MGCTDSKTLDTSSSRNSKDTPSYDSSKVKESHDIKLHCEDVSYDKERDYVTQEEAIAYVMDELETTESRARLLVQQAQTDDDPRVSNQELRALWGKIKDKKLEIKSEFLAMDIDGSGFVSPDEAVVVLARRFPGLPEESVRAMVYRYDTDDNGKMQYEEFIYFYGNMVAKRESLETDFEVLANENRGKLPCQELIELLAKQCVLEEYMARALVEGCDINKDGYINKTEFTELMTKMFG